LRRKRLRRKWKERGRGRRDRRRSCGCGGRGRRLRCLASRENEIVEVGVLIVKKVGVERSFEFRSRVVDGSKGRKQEEFVFVKLDIS
jgi:hypothetical protein